MLYSLDNLKIMCEGNHDFEKLMIQTFVDTLPNSIEQLNTSHKDGNIVAINKMAHKIKTSVRTFLIKEVEQDIITLEKFDLNTSSLKELAELIQKTSSILTTVVKELQENELKNQ